MSGIQEILVVILVFLVIFYLPKRAARNNREILARSSLPLSFRLRLGILASLVWLSVLAGALHMLAGDWVLLIYAGVGPVLLAWGIAWVVTARNRR